ncbi:MAG: hypothetical protein QW424_05175 [Candidatus Bathyarchaeia archaeon]
MPCHFIRFGPFGFGLSIWGPEWWPHWIDVERTVDEVILTLRIPRDLKKEDIKVEFREGQLRIRFPRRGGEWEPIKIE